MPSPFASRRTSSRAPNGSSVPRISKRKYLFDGENKDNFYRKQKKSARKTDKVNLAYHILAPMFVIMQTPFATAKGKRSCIHSETIPTASNQLSPNKQNYHISINTDK